MRFSWRTTARGVIVGGMATLTAAALLPGPARAAAGDQPAPLRSGASRQSSGE
jgi:hypothetical protein